MKCNFLRLIEAMSLIIRINAEHNLQHNMGQVTKLRLSCYLVLLSIDSKTS